MPHIVAAESWLSRNSGEIVGVVVPLLVAAALVVLLDRFLLRRAARLALAVTGGQGPSREARTRLRFARRALEALIVLVAVVVALSQIDGLQTVTSTILASSAITAAVLGFAARQTVANAIAGIMLAVVQPVRIGDLVTFEGETGTVEDVGLTYTWLRTGADARILIPNERLAAGMIRNDSIRSATVATEVSVWIGAEADVDRAMAAVEGVGVRARLAEMTADGLRLVILGEPGPPAERLAREGELRVAALRALRHADVR